MKPLFIPLKAKYYDAFAHGDKHTEYRVYGPRWNERTCIPGREVILSRGYGKKNRLHGKVRDFKVSPRHCDSEEWRMIYGDKSPAACIGITLT